LFWWYRVVTGDEEQEIGGHHFTGFGAHHSSYPCTYLTAAAALGITKSDVDNFIRRLDKVFAKKTKATSKQAAEATLTQSVNGSMPCSSEGAAGDSQCHAQYDNAAAEIDSSADEDETNVSV